MAPRAGDANGRNGGGRGCLGSIARFWTRSYAPDYVGFAVLMTGYLLIAFFLDPFHRMFSISDLNISYPHAEVERVSVPMNFVYALFIPLFVLVLINFMFGASAHKHHVTILGLAIALILASTITDLIKNMVGRPRPDLLARCKPRAGTPTNTLVTFEVCTETDHHRLHDGWRSFPSGHSTFSFAGLGYTSLFLAAQLRVFVIRSSGGGSAASDGSGGGMEGVVHVRGDLGRALVCLAPLLGATMIAISRCQDYRHDVYDVCTGSLIGWVVGYWSYRRYWPRLSNRHCDEPYPGPSALGREGDRYRRLQDEEEGGQTAVGYELSEFARRERLT